jgi:transcriptional regulator with XRE-family HTH domain
MFMTSAKALHYLKPNVQHYCHVMGISQAELARRLKMQPQQLSNQLSGKRDVRISLLDRLAKELEIEPALLLISPELKSDVAKQKDPQLEQVFKRLKNVEDLIHQSDELVRQGEIKDPETLKVIRAILDQPPGNKALLGALSALIATLGTTSTKTPLPKSSTGS